MNKAVVLVLDGFGVGAMDDVVTTRRQDIGSNTAKHILCDVKIKLPMLEKLGLMNVLGYETSDMKFSETANFGVSNLAHFGADTFFGHQEILGTKPKKPKLEAFSVVLEDVELKLLDQGYKVKRIKKSELELLCIDDSVYIGDNLETDLGQVYNVTGSFDYFSFDEIKEIGKVVRNSVFVDRVICFGGEEVSKEDIYNAIETKNSTYIGVNAPKSGVYNKGYNVIHMGYGVDESVQVQSILSENGIKTAFVGKAADICKNEAGTNIPVVDTKEVMRETIRLIKSNDFGFILSNVQETDLLGHAEDSINYAAKLKVVDDYLERLIEVLADDDILVIMADHGNDPTVGHSKHTREKVPLLVYKRNVVGSLIGERGTMSDVAATVAEFHNVKIDNGLSFLHKLI